ncbi:MAG: hypothetical protein AAFQ51_10550 [Pseudomonadota bacterium]
MEPTFANLVDFFSNWYVFVPCLIALAVDRLRLAEVNLFHNRLDADAALVAMVFGIVALIGSMVLDPRLWLAAIPAFCFAVLRLFSLTVTVTQGLWSYVGLKAPGDLTDTLWDIGTDYLPEPLATIVDGTLFVVGGTLALMKIWQAVTEPGYSEV